MKFTAMVLISQSCPPNPKVAQAKLIVAGNNQSSSSSFSDCALMRDKGEGNDVADNGDLVLLDYVCWQISDDKVWIGPQQIIISSVL